MHNTQNKFPFEGIRFFFNSSENHLTIRSSSTESKIRLFIQLKIIPEGRNLLKTKCDGIAAANIFHHIEHSVYLAKDFLSKKSKKFRTPKFYHD